MTHCDTCGSPCEEPVTLLEYDDRPPGDSVVVLCCFCLPLALYDAGVFKAELVEGCE